MSPPDFSGIYSAFSGCVGDFRTTDDRQLEFENSPALTLDFPCILREFSAVGRVASGRRRNGRERKSFRGEAGHSLDLVNAGPKCSGKTFHKKSGINFLPYYIVRVKGWEASEGESDSFRGKALKAASSDGKISAIWNGRCSWENSRERNYRRWTFGTGRPKRSLMNFIEPFTLLIQTFSHNGCCWSRVLRCFHSPQSLHNIWNFFLLFR